MVMSPKGEISAQSSKDGYEVGEGRTISRKSKKYPDAEEFDCEQSRDESHPAR